MALIKLAAAGAAAGAAAFGLYRMIARQNDMPALDTGDRLQLAGAGITNPGANPGAPTTLPNTPVGQGGQYVPPT